MNNSSLIEDKSLQTISESDNSYSSQNLSEPQITNINSKRKKKSFITLNTNMVDWLN